MATSNEKARNAASAERRADIVAAARELYEEQGLSKTSVQDITNRMGVARSLFYHYFPDKEAVTSAVLDDYVADFIEATHYWNAQRRLIGVFTFQIHSRSPGGSPDASRRARFSCAGA